MHAIAHDARLDTRREDGSLERAQVQVFADKGQTWAIERLKPRPVPDYIAYLGVWSSELAQGQGEGMSGRAPLTWAVVDAWATRTFRHPAPHELSALFQLDAVRRNPAALPEVKTPDAPKRKAGALWPTRKAAS